MAGKAADAGARTGSGAAGHAFGDWENIVNRAFDPDMAFHEGLAEFVQVRRNEVAQRRGLGNGDGHAGIGREIESIAVPELDSQWNLRGFAHPVDGAFEAILQKHRSSNL